MSKLSSSFIFLFLKSCFFHIFIRLSYKIKDRKTLAEKKRQTWRHKYTFENTIVTYDTVNVHESSLRVPKLILASRSLRYYKHDHHLLETDRRTLCLRSLVQLPGEEVWVLNDNQHNYPEHELSRVMKRKTIIFTQKYELWDLRL